MSKKLALMETEENHGWKLRKKLKWSIALMQTEKTKMKNAVLIQTEEA
jgi:hypothetical protein